MISPLPGATTLKPGSATFPLPGIGADIVERRRRVRCGDPRRRLPRAHPAVAVDAARHLGRPASATARRTGAGSPASTSPATAPSATTTGYYWLLGRVDDVMLVSGHNISTAEVEHALVGHPAGRRGRRRRPHRRDHRPGDRRVRDPARRATSRATRSSPSSATTWATRSARSPSRRRSCSPRTCPKTRSGKIMRRLLRNVSEDEALGDTTTLADPSVVEGIKARYLAAAERASDEE